MPRFRLLPTTIIVAMLFSVVKMADVINGTEEASVFFVAEVQAESAPEESDSTAKGEEKETVDCKPEEKEERENKRVTDTPGTTIDNNLSEVQIQLLQKLAERRQELARWESDILLKENLLSATQKSIDNRIEEIEVMKTEVSAMLALYNEKEDTKIRSLVKIYESMKPKDAARIFDEVDMPILLIVIDKMSEKKVAPILASMDPKKVRTLTIQLAEQRKVNMEKLSRMAKQK